MSLPSLLPQSHLLCDLEQVTSLAVSLSEGRAARHGFWSPLTLSCPGRVAGSHGKGVLAGSFLWLRSREAGPAFLATGLRYELSHAGYLEFKPNRSGALMAPGDLST